MDDILLSKKIHDDNEPLSIVCYRPFIIVLFSLKKCIGICLQTIVTQKRYKTFKYSATHFRSYPVRNSSMNFHIFAHIFIYLGKQKMNEDDKNMKGFKVLY